MFFNLFCIVLAFGLSTAAQAVAISITEEEQALRMVELKEKIKELEKAAN